MELRAYLEGSRSLMAARVHRDGAIAWTNPALARVLPPLATEHRFVDIVAERQRARISALIASVGDAWVRTLIGIAPGEDSIPIDYELAARADGEHVLVIAEPIVDASASRERELVDLTDDLVTGQRELSQENRRLSRQATTDPLTGVANRRALEQALGPILETARTSGRGMAAVMLDLDHFKAVNDTYGHAMGDLVLETVAGCLRAVSRPTDLVARFGGEEFLVLLADSSMSIAAAWAERARAAIELAVIDGVPGGVTGSFGVAGATPDDTAETLLARADAAMYRAKQLGRNQVAIG